MTEPPHHKSMSQILAELEAEPDGAISVGQIVHRLGPRAFGALLFIFSAPNLLPTPPGTSTVLGLPLVLLAPQVAMGVHAPWLPQFVDRREIQTRGLRTLFSRMLPWVKRIEKVSRPRLAFMFGPVGDRLIGLVCTLLALILILPIFGANMLPAAAVSMLGLALVQRDGVLAILGYVLTAASIAVLVLLAGVARRMLDPLMQLVGLA